MAMSEQIYQPISILNLIEVPGTSPSTSLIEVPRTSPGTSQTFLLPDVAIVTAATSSVLPTPIPEHPLTEAAGAFKDSAFWDTVEAEMALRRLPWWKRLWVR
jgi:hypothetical protein